MQKKLSFIFIFFVLYANSTPVLALSVATWNLEWLSTSPASNTKLKIPQRSSADFQQLNTLFRQQNIDILAFQEVNDVKAVRNVVGNDYNIVLSDRSKAQWRKLQFNDINQYTGFAIRKSLLTEDPTDIQLISKEKLRFATYLKLKSPKKPDIHLLSVHLKSGCFGKWKSGKKACVTLKQQGVVLRQWIADRIHHQDSFVILGDFNHNLSYPNDWFWNELTAKHKTHLTLATNKTQSDCKMIGRNGKPFHYRHIIDHIITSKDISISHPRQEVYPIEVLQQYQLSDHCLLKGQLQ